jgi:hypothetical protein
MSAGGINLGGYRANRGSRILWREVPGIYKARLQNLGQVMKLSFLAALLLVSTVVLLPMVLGIGLFTGHFLWTAVGLGVVLFVTGWIYWTSLKLAFLGWKGR